MTVTVTRAVTNDEGNIVLFQIASGTTPSDVLTALQGMRYSYPRNLYPNNADLVVDAYAAGLPGATAGSIGVWSDIPYGSQGYDVYVVGDWVIYEMQPLSTPGGLTQWMIPLHSLGTFGSAAGNYNGQTLTYVLNQMGLVSY